jgi:1,4-dihydroxy-2-naphthoate octaprenyltransferase
LPSPPEKNVGHVRFWLQLARADYAPAVAASIVVGSLYAVHDAFPFRLAPFALALAGGTSTYLGAMIVIALLELLLGLEPVAADPDLRRMRGADVIAAALVGVPAAAGLAGFLLLVGLLCGLALVGYAGSLTVWAGMLGLILAVAYAVPDIGLRDLAHGLGELGAFVAFGPLPVLGGYAAQTGRFSFGAILVSLPLGLYGASVVYCFHLSRPWGDDERRGPSMVTVLGESRAWLGCWLLPLLAYAAMLFDASLDEYPLWCLAGLLTLPALVWRLMRLGRVRNPATYDGLTRAAAMLHTVTGALIAAGFGIALAGAG